MTICGESEDVKAETGNRRIVNIDGLTKYLQTTVSNVRRFWKEYPHIFVGTGSDLKAARFDIEDVLLYLKLHKGVGYERVAGSGNGQVEVQIRISKKEIQEGGLFNATGGFDRGGEQKEFGKRGTQKRGSSLCLLGRNSRSSISNTAKEGRWGLIQSDRNISCWPISASALEINPQMTCKSGKLNRI